MSSHHHAQEELIKELQRKNGSLSEEDARKWIELLWEDFEATRAKAGRKYRGSEMTEQIVRQWVTHYGAHLDEFIATNPKFNKYFGE
ncbi:MULTISPECIES: YfhJ family protein [Salimicrobium]|uniref:WVELL protein n=1 Tax=Salimicrobium humidisoli TaxID=2029857 RepID=A0ABX4HP23_9BACI|nr:MULTISPECIES: YfhJ family protein [Salimicrobium]PBB04941.1 hypothetical protein CKW00_11390 [Salimicrobium humidisoli]